MRFFWLYYLCRVRKQIIESLNLDTPDFGISWMCGIDLTLRLP